MLREMLGGKIHHGTVTDTKLTYAGSLTVDLDLIDRAGMVPYQKIQLVNSNNANRLETYLIPGERGKKEIIVNGAAARLAYVGDTVIIIAYVMVDEQELQSLKPKVIILGEGNQIVEELAS
ncbi:MAG: aspartate 1-decarboxylase [Planctomycetes bacterium]|nr:aspartate 1-decarboxylase [Planctomycetota bacterium]